MRSGCTGRGRRRRSDARGSRKLQRYVAAAAAAAAGGAAGSVVEAAIVSQTGLSLSTPTTLALTSGTSTVVTFGFTKFSGYGGTFSSITTSNLTSAPGGGVAPVWVQLGQASAAANAAGVMIDGSIPNSSGATQSNQLAWLQTSPGPSTVTSSLNGSYGSYVGNFNDLSGYGANVSGYIGIRFKNPLQGNAINYGWIAYTGSVDGSGLITGWGYDDSGAGIATGAVAVPEPSGLALLAAGTLAGTAAVTAKRWRRERTLRTAA